MSTGCHPVLDVLASTRLCTGPYSFMYSNFRVQDGNPYLFMYSNFREIGPTSVGHTVYIMGQLIIKYLLDFLGEKSSQTLVFIKKHFCQQIFLDVVIFC